MSIELQASSEANAIDDADEHDVDADGDHRQLSYISIFSGIEAASRAFEPLGWDPVAFSEYAAFPSAVLEERYPGVPNLGDITSVDWSPYKDTVNLIVGGSPCQTFSLAGNRTGLAGASGLMWEYIRAVRDVRPDWFLWENVPGALSADHGDAYQQLLENMDSLGYGMAWRVLDSQFFGVAQRRRRLFLVGRRINTMPTIDDNAEKSVKRSRPKSRRRARGDDTRDYQSVRAANAAARVLFESTADIDRNESAIDHRNAILESQQVDTSSDTTGPMILPSNPHHGGGPTDNHAAATIIDAIADTDDGHHQNAITIDSMKARAGGHGTVSGKVGDKSHKWLSGGMIADGRYWMTRAVEWPLDSRVTVLHSVLEPSVDEKYFLSAKACRGVLSRAAKRGKKIPDSLLYALEMQAGIRSVASQSDDQSASDGHDADSDPIADASDDSQSSLTQWDAQGNRIYSSRGIAPTISTGGTKNGSVLIDDASDDADCLTPWDYQNNRIYSPDGVFPSLSARETSGSSNQSVATQFGHEIAGSLTARADSSPCVDRGQNIVYMDGDGDGDQVPPDDAHTDNAPTDANVDSFAFSVGQSSGAGSLGLAKEIAPTIRSGAGGNQIPAVYQTSDETLDDHPVVFAINQRDEVRDIHDCSVTIAAKPGVKGQTYVAFKWQNAATAGLSANDDISPTLEASRKTIAVSITDADAADENNGDKSSINDDGYTGYYHDEDELADQYDDDADNVDNDSDGKQPRLYAYLIRRLTPVECERLMGFPDGWTNVTYHGKPAKNGPRYTALGNSMVVNVMAWIGEGIRDAEKTSQ